MAMLFSCPATIAGEHQQILKVPVIYVTDRQPLKNSFGPRRLLEKDTVSGLRSGVVEVCVPQTNSEQLADWQKTENITPADAMQAPEIKQFNCHSTADLSGEFDTAVKDQLTRSPKKELFVFIHGFNNSFDVAAENAAQLAVCTGCPVVLYSWPSASKLYRYSLDECNNEWSQEHFNQFLEHLLQLKDKQGCKLNLVAHSMGNRLFVRAVPVLAGKGIFNDIFMVNPDFDAETFIHYLARYIPPGGLKPGVRAQLLISRKDKALAAAEGLFGGYTRLGQGLDSSLSAITSPQIFSNLWSHAGGSHPEADAKDTSANPALVASIQKDCRIYDVTELDHGIIGHKVPHEFIGWMHFRDQAPPGYEIIVSKSQGGNRMSRLFARKLKQYIESPSGDISIVTKSNSGKVAQTRTKGSF